MNHSMQRPLPDEDPVLEIQTLDSCGLARDVKDSWSVGPLGQCIRDQVPIADALLPLSSHSS